jgi:hypothetical protein
VTLSGPRKASICLAAPPRATESKPVLTPSLLTPPFWVKEHRDQVPDRTPAQPRAPPVLA